VDRHLPHDTARNARFFIGVVNAAKMGILSAGQQHLIPNSMPGDILVQRFPDPLGQAHTSGRMCDPAARLAASAADVAAIMLDM
jgi:hypothetical protein